MSVAGQTRGRRGLSTGTRRLIWLGIAILLVLFLALGTRVVSNDDPLAKRDAKFDAATYGAETFPKVQEGVLKRAVDAKTVADVVAADPAAAAEKYAVQSSGGPVFSVTVKGVVGKGQSGIYEIAVDGLPKDLLVRVQTGPAINGTELRDATGKIKFGEFKNQIDYQNAAAALNAELKKAVLADIDTAALTGKTVEFTGAFTLINPKAWLITPVKLAVE